MLFYSNNRWDSVFLWNNTEYILFTIHILLILYAGITNWIILVNVRDNPFL